VTFDVIGLIGAIGGAITIMLALTLFVGVLLHRW
jgi:hypothetical protein